MKTTPRKRSAGFTLIELMAVITIIVILAGLVVGSLGYVFEKQASSKAKVQIALISKALEEYKLDMGTYPTTDNKTTFDPTAGTATSADLYNTLYSEGFEYNKQSPPPNTWEKTVGTNKFPKATKIYIADLEPLTNKQGWSSTPAGKILDPWGKEYCYRTAKDSNGVNNDATQNPDFDLWSMGKDGKTKPATTSDTTNRDDIKNF